jgi:hypothetical protein
LITYFCLSFDLRYLTHEQEVGGEKLWGLLQQLGLKQDTRTFIAFGLVQKRMHVYLAALPPSLYEPSAPVIQHLAEITSLLASLSVLKFNPGTNGGLQRVSTVTWDDLPSDTSHMLYVLPFKLPSAADSAAPAPSPTSTSSTSNTSTTSTTVPSPGTSEGSRPATPAETASRPITPSTVPAPTEARDIGRLPSESQQNSLISFSPPAPSPVSATSAPDHAFYSLFTSQPLTPSPVSSPAPVTRLDTVSPPPNSATSERLRQEALRREQQEQRREELARQERNREEARQRELVQREAAQREAEQREATQKEAEAVRPAVVPATELVEETGGTVSESTPDEESKTASETDNSLEEPVLTPPEATPPQTLATADPLPPPDSISISESLRPAPTGPDLFDVFASSVVVPPTETSFPFTSSSAPVPPSPASDPVTPFFDLSVFASPSPSPASPPPNTAELEKLKGEIKELRQLLRAQAEGQASSAEEGRRGQEQVARLEAKASEDAATIATLQTQLAESRCVSI